VEIKLVLEAQKSLHLEAQVALVLLQEQSLQEEKLALEVLKLLHLVDKQLALVQLEEQLLQVEVKLELEVQKSLHQEVVLVEEVQQPQGEQL